MAAVSEWEVRIGLAKVQQPFSTVQTIWDAPLVKTHQVIVFVATSDQTGKARLIVAATPHSRAFLHARPCTSLGTRLDNLSLRTAVALRLGAPVCCHTRVYAERQLITPEDTDSVVANLLADFHVITQSINWSNARWCQQRFHHAWNPHHWHNIPRISDPDGMSLTPWTHGRIRLHMSLWSHIVWPLP